MAQPSRPQRRPARESPEEGHYSGLHSGSEVPTARPSQLFKVWLCGRVWYQRSADSLLVALVPLTSSQLLSPSLPRLSPSAVSPHAEWRSSPEGVSRARALSACDNHGCAKAELWPWQRLLSRSISNRRRRGCCSWFHTLASCVRASLAL